MRTTFTRRHFLSNASLVALAPAVPAFLSRAARAETPNDNGRILVVIQLDGGNDGINTVVSYRDEAYAKHRKTLRLRPDAVIKLNDDIALHPSMRAAADLLADGRLAIVQGAGYPNPSRSHEVSMNIWQTARPRSFAEESFGWIGRSTDAMKQPADGSPSSILFGSESPPIALQAHKSTSVAMAHLRDLQRTDDSAAIVPANAESDDLRAFVQRTTLDAYAAADLLRDVSTADSLAAYPSFQLAQRMYMIAQLIKSGFATPVYYTIHAGFDTHYVQLETHASLLYQLSASLKAFLEDLRAAKLDDRVLVLCFSEFGRRVEENASQGTDHGTAGPMFLAGTSVR
ncbi:MAG: DUF1501 domain-containing protein, partial [Planctomycetaceae bacterium]|nr:DUF1501 domain-containing protein [Planctomycetaceae bacterium]